MGVLDMQRRRFVGLVSATLGAALPSRALGASRVRLAMIVASDSRLQDIDLEQVQRLFGGEPEVDKQGHSLIPFNHPILSPDRVGFDRTVLGMSPDKMSKYWVDRRIRGQPGPPRIAPSLQVLLGVVSRLPGAIAYLRPEYLVPGVRALKVSGYALNSESYPVVFAE